MMLKQNNATTEMIKAEVERRNMKTSNIKTEKQGTIMEKLKDPETQSSDVCCKRL